SDGRLSSKFCLLKFLSGRAPVALVDGIAGYCHISDVCAGVWRVRRKSSHNIETSIDPPCHCPAFLDFHEHCPQQTSVGHHPLLAYAPPSVSLAGRYIRGGADPHGCERPLLVETVSATPALARLNHERTGFVCRDLLAFADGSRCCLSIAANV